MTAGATKVSAPAFPEAVRQSGRQFFSNRHVTLTESSDLHLQLKAVAENDVAKQLERSSRERYYEILAYTGAMYLWIDGHPDRDALFQACAAEVGFKRFLSASSYMSCVLLRVIGYGPSKERKSQRQFWNRDANAILRLLIPEEEHKT